MNKKLSNPRQAGQLPASIGPEKYAVNAIQTQTDLGESSPLFVDDDPNHGRIYNKIGDINFE